MEFPPLETILSNGGRINLIIRKVLMKIEEGKMKPNQDRVLVKLMSMLEAQVKLSEDMADSLQSLARSVSIQTLAMSNFVKAQEEINSDNVSNDNVFKSLCEEQLNTMTQVMEALKLLVKKEIERSSVLAEVSDN